MNTTTNATSTPTRKTQLRINTKGQYRTAVGNLIDGDVIAVEATVNGPRFTERKTGIVEATVTGLTSTTHRSTMSMRSRSVRTYTVTTSEGDLQGAFSQTVTVLRPADQV